MQHAPVAEIVALLRRQHFHKGFFHLHRVCAVRHKAQPPGHADAVGVGHHGGQVENIAAYQVRAFAPDAGQAQKVLHGLGHLAAVFVDEHPAHGGQVPRFAAAQPAGLYNGLDGFGLGPGKGLQRGVAGAQLLRHNVHPRVGALGAQPHADKQLPRAGVIQAAQGQGVRFL